MGTHNPHIVAATMLGGAQFDSSRLHYDLYNFLAIVVWQRAHPSLKPLGK